MTPKIRPLQCMECGKKLTLRQAEHAMHGDGCPRCGGSDIDTADYQPRPVATRPVYFPHGKDCRCGCGPIYGAEAEARRTVDEDEGCGTCGQIDCAGERLAF